RVESDIERLSQRYDEPVLRTLTTLPRLASDLSDSDPALAEWVAQLDAALPKRDPDVRPLRGGDAHYEARLAGNDDDDADHWFVVIDKTRHGVTTAQQIEQSFFERGDYHRLTEYGSEVGTLIEPGATVKRGERTSEIATFGAAIGWLLSEARRGQTIQRYKGLGEMNPDQLWDTTVNPDTRRLMQVKIEDAIAADQIFTTLMGDQVEPRREFIEQNAMAVSNLDI
ncbi:MAG: DNA gyrase subunit B, partial [Pseudomonadota bacterium]